MLCGAFHFNCTTFSFNLYGVEAMKIKYKCEICKNLLCSAPKFEKHIDEEHKEIGKVLYFQKYLLKIPDEKYGKCLVCGEPLDTNGSKFSFKYENGFRCHTHRKLEQWQLDENKKLCAERKGFKIYYIWENDYVNNSNKIIEDCLSFLKMED